VTDHPMYGVLRGTLDALTPAECRSLARLVLEYEDDTMIGRLLDAVVHQLYAEHVADWARETTVLHDLEAEHRAYVDEVDLRVNGPYPVVQGRAAEIDPDTGKILPASDTP